MVKELEDDHVGGETDSDVMTGAVLSKKISYRAVKGMSKLPLLLTRIA